MPLPVIPGKLTPMPIERTSKFHAADLELAAEKLESLAAMLRAAAVQADERGEIWAFRRKSLELGLDRLAAFKTELENSLDAIRLGRPYGPDEAKGRSSAPKKKSATRRSRKK